VERSRYHVSSRPNRENHAPRLTPLSLIYTLTTMLTSLHPARRKLFHNALPLLITSSSHPSSHNARFITSSPTSPSSNSSQASPQTIFSGIQPTGTPHLGNYLGALLPWVTLSQTCPPSTRLFFSIVDLHAITVSQSPKQLREWRKEMLRVLLALGLGEGRGGSTVFVQSHVRQHAEVMWILSCTASMGYLGRMTQWKVCSSLLIFQNEVLG
jgi:tryptophanyl-tRNA synthetase